MSAEERFLYQLRLTNLAIEAEKEKRLRKTGYSHAQYAFLINVRNYPDSSGAELAPILAVSPQNVATMGNRLEQKGLITRTPNPRFSHIKEHHLTDKGKKALKETDKVIAGLEADIRANIGIEDVTRAKGLLYEVLQYVKSL